ncbi:MAG: DUF4129 domain-containing protein [Chloroflexi bacterium]|nr:DUF4129 domain-containing protein [Chloroflexota bacterium]
MSKLNVERAVLAALVVAESAWLYAAMAVFGVGLGADKTPLGWTGVISLLAVSALVARVLQSIALPMWARYALQMVGGAVTIYLVIATQVSGGQQMFDLSWVGTLMNDASDGQYILRGMLGSIFAIFLWWRGGRIASNESIIESLSFSFRLGAFFMALAVVVDVASDSDLNTFPMLFLFFAAALGGLGVGRLAPDSERGAGVGPWLKVLAAIVVGVLLLGLLFSLLSKDELVLVSGPIGWVLGWIGTGFFYAFIVPVAFVVNAIVGFIVRLIRREDASTPASEGPISFGEQFLERPDAATPIYITVVEWFLFALLVSLVLYFLARAFQRRRRVRALENEGVRESLREGADPGHDLAEALLSLLPSMFRRRKGQSGVVLPEGPPGIVEAIRLYYRMLFWAERREVHRVAHETPSEYAARAASALSRAPVADVTRVFDDAYYGNRAADTGVLDGLREKLDHLGAPEVQ